jgi:putative monooxygenase
MLTPQTVGSTTGNMGLLILSPGEWNAEHIHPFSEEYLIVTQGALLIRVDGVPHTLRPQQGLIVPINARHRLWNEGGTAVQVIYALAPSPPVGEQMHIFTEALPAGEGGEALAY